jgi:hypothetical protein
MYVRNDGEDTLFDFHLRTKRQKQFDTPALRGIRLIYVQPVTGRVEMGSFCEIVDNWDKMARPCGTATTTIKTTTTSP